VFVLHIVELRKKRGWSRNELGRRSGLSGVGIGLIERGKRNMKIDTAVKIAKALGVTLDDLVEIEN